MGTAGEVKVEAEAGEEEVTGEVEDSISTSMETEVRAIEIKDFNNHNKSRLLF